MVTKVITGIATENAIASLTAHEALEQFSSEDIAQAWGLSCSYDIYNCNPETIRDANAIKIFVSDLCELISMKPYGECTVVNFGADERVEGFSMTQLIETSLISAHFSNASNAVYLDVFSCKLYDPEIVEKFAVEFFEGSKCVTKISLRQ